MKVFLSFSFAPWYKAYMWPGMRKTGNTVSKLKSTKYRYRIYDRSRLLKVVSICSRVFVYLKHVYIRNQTEEAEWTVPQYREESSFIPNTVSQRRDEKPHTTGLDDTAIPHIKIKITEITLEKELNTENPPVFRWTHSLRRKYLGHFNQTLFFSFSWSPRPSQSCSWRFGHQILYTNTEGTRRPQSVPTILTETAVFQ